MSARLPRRLVRLAAISLVILLLGQVWAIAAERAKSRHRARPRGVLPAIPFERPDPPVPLRAATKHIVAPTPKPKPHAAPPVAFKKPQRARTVFSGLGAWVDQFDFGDLDLGSTIATMRANGVHTLYLQSGESSDDEDVLAADGPWLAAAHQAGIKVVAWYLPHYSDVNLDVARMVAAARYVYDGQRFDGVGVDIEYRRAVKGQQWMTRVAQHMALVRRALGARYPLAAIPPPPLQMAVAPGYWAGFPWASIGRSSSEIMLMAYWSARGDCPQNPLHCAYGYTKENVLATRALTGNRVPVHVIGGVGSRITATDVAAFVRGARDAHADGASLYDFGTTDATWWRTLRALRSLGS